MIQFTESASEFGLYGKDKHTHGICLRKSHYAISGFFTTTNTEHIFYLKIISRQISTLILSTIV